MTPDDVLVDDEVWGTLSYYRPDLTGAVAYCRAVSAGNITEDTTFAEIEQQFGSGTTYEVDWNALGLSHMIEFGHAYENDSDGEMPGSAHTPQILKRMVRDLNDAVWEKVREGVTTLESQLNPELTAAEMPLDQIDWTQLQAWNEAILKNLEAGNATSFWQSGGYVVIGDDNYEPWKRAVEAANGLQPSGNQPTGSVNMDARGGFASRGSMTVSGSPDEAAFKAAVREFSQKAIEFE
jgi:hypothetical protein